MDDARAGRDPRRARRGRRLDPVSPALWHAVRRLARPVASAESIWRSSSRRRRQDYVTSVIAVALGAIGHRHCLDALRLPQVGSSPRVPALQRSLEHKFYFDELYDAIFYRPAGLPRTPALRRDREAVDRGLDLGSSRSAPGQAGRCGRCGSRPAYLRSYALAIAAAVAVLIVVFVMRSTMTTCAHLPAARRRGRHLDPAAVPLRDRGPGGARLARRGGAVDFEQAAGSTSARVSSSYQHQTLVQRARGLVLGRACTGSSSGSWGSRWSRAAAIGYGLLGRVANDRVRTSG